MEACTLVKILSPEKVGQQGGLDCSPLILRTSVSRHGGGIGVRRQGDQKKKKTVVSNVACLASCPCRRVTKGEPQVHACACSQTSCNATLASHDFRELALIS